MGESGPRGGRWERADRPELAGVEPLPIPEPERAGLHPVEPGVYEVTREPAPRGSLAAAWRRLRRVLIGRPIRTAHEAQERLAKPSALALLGADCIASSIYGPEEIMRALMLAGAGALALATPLSVAIVVLLAVVALSYRQTIRAYPNGGGSYIVATDNLGPRCGLVAGCALMIDYVLDVAVSVAAGVQSLTSVFPSLHGERVWMCLAAIAVMALANMRGVRASGALSAVPVYVYLAGVLGMAAYGAFRWSTGTLPPYTPPPDALAQAVQPLGLLLVLRAFSSGAVALSGVEAISNGVPAFQAPERENAQKTLTWMAVIFAVLFLGITILAGRIGIVPDPREVETVVSQLTRTLLGRGWFYFVVQGSTMVLLVLAANTAFADFPRLASIMARDRFLPEHFAYRGERLAFSSGIGVLAAVAALLIVVFQASLAGLIPLFTIGVFISFTLSEAGMVVHWWRARTRGWRASMAINGLGAAATLVVAVIVGVSKFALGAWVVLLLLPLFVALLKGIRRHYDTVRRQVQVETISPQLYLERLVHTFRHDVLILVGDLDRTTLRAVAYARSVFSQTERGKDVPPARIIAVHVADDLDAGGRFKARWEAAQLGVPIVVIESPYRTLVGPLLTYIRALQHAAAPGTSLVTIVLPEFIAARWWQHALHTQTALLLKGALLFRPGIAVVSVPFHLRD